MNEDLKHIWHPCTQMKDHENFEIIPIKKGRGVWLEDFDGNFYIDAISSWWVNILGHCNKRLNKSINMQLQDLEHVILAGFTHLPAIKLAKKLCEISPEGLDKVFFADNGSSGIEVALKMSFHYFKNKGETRPYFVSLENSYHGETIGALSVSDMGIYKEPYSELLIHTIQTKTPKNKSDEETRKALDDFEDLLQNRCHEISAFIIEPLVQCAGLMNMHSEKFVQGMHNLCKKYGVLFIADEVAVGFGRTGTLFACEQAEISPDLMVLSKGLTGGYLPLSTVLVTNDIYNQFYCDYNPVKTFLHSHSYTANPLSCSVALASIEYLESKNIIQKNQSKIKYISKKLEKIQTFSNVLETRQTGMIAAIELRGFQNIRIGPRIAKLARAKKVLLRPLGNVIYIMPPYVITKKELDLVFDTICEILEILGQEN